LILLHGGNVFVEIGDGLRTQPAREARLDALVEHFETFSMGDEVGSIHPIQIVL
jgi:hypothetical protein